MGLPIERSFSNLSFENKLVVTLVEDLENRLRSVHGIGSKRSTEARTNNGFDAPERPLFIFQHKIRNGMRLRDDTLEGLDSMQFVSMDKSEAETDTGQDTDSSRSTRVGDLLRENTSIQLYRPDILAYPLIDTKNIQQLGFFAGTEIVWGVENEANGSGVVSTWVDTWKAKSKFELSRISGKIISFHPSPGILDDNTWFAIIKRGKAGDFYSHDLLVGKIVRGSVFNSCISKTYVLMRFDTTDDNRIDLVYASASKKLHLRMQDALRVNELNSCTKVLPGRDSSVCLDISQWNSKSGLVKVDEENFIVKSMTRKPDRHEIMLHEAVSIRRFIRPFWSKKGKSPSTKPSWYPGRYRTLEYWPHNRSDSSQSGLKLSEAIRRLKPGDRLLVHEGIYSMPRRFDVRLKGLEDKPILVEAAAGERVVITRADDRENLMDIRNSEYIVISGFEFIGGSTGIRIRSSNNIMVENCSIHDIGNVGIAANSDSMTRLYIVDNEIFNTDGHAEGIYLGSHDGTATVSNCVISGNYIHDLGAGPENQGDGIEVKDGSHGNLIQRNFITRTKYPNITVYSSGGRVEQPNRIDQNVLFDSEDCGIQVNSEAVIQGNLMFTKRFGVVSRPFMEEPHNLNISNNTILAEGFCLKASQWNSRSIVFTKNKMYSRDKQYFYSGSGLAISSDNTFVQNLPKGLHDQNYTRFMQAETSTKTASRDERGILDSFGFLIDDSVDSKGTAKYGSIRHTHTDSMQAEDGHDEYVFNDIQCRAVDDKTIELTLPRAAGIAIGADSIRVSLLSGNGEYRIDALSIVASLHRNYGTIDLWAKDDQQGVYFRSIDISSELATSGVFHLNLVATLLDPDPIAFRTCDQQGNLLVGSSKGLLCIPKN